jgi:DNA repair exonuclease SbcCD ATPase subunit
MRLATALVVVLATGCAALKPGAEEAGVVNEIVAMAVDTLRSTPDVQRARLSTALDALASRQDDAARLRAGILLATLPPPLRDDARAAALIQPIAARQAETPLVQFAGLFQARLAEGERMAEQLHERVRSAEKQAETLRGEAEALRANERSVAEREEALRRRTQMLQRGLAEREEMVRRQAEALRESERTMAEREETVRRQIEALRESERSMSEREGRLGTKTR